MQALKAQFLESQALASAVSASLQRSRTYSSGVHENARRHLHEEMQRVLSDIAGRYCTAVSERDHLDNLSEFATRVTEACRPLLANGRLRLGVAQKALNLYLKYLWCFGQIAEPPHCPFDARIIAKLPREAQLPWTHLDDIRQYQALVAAARHAAGGESLAAWELRAYQGA